MIQLHNVVRVEVCSDARIVDPSYQKVRSCNVCCASNK